LAVGKKIAERNRERLKPTSARGGTGNAGGGVSKAPVRKSAGRGIRKKRRAIFDHRNNL